MVGLQTKMSKHGRMTKINLMIILTTVTAFFLTYQQMLAYHQWLSYCPDEAALFQNFEVSKPVCTAFTNVKMSLIELS
jgi:hypothetical protein